MKLWHRNWHRT